MSSRWYSPFRISRSREQTWSQRLRTCGYRHRWKTREMGPMQACDTGANILQKIITQKSETTLKVSCV